MLNHCCKCEKYAGIPYVYPSFWQTPSCGGLVNDEKVRRRIGNPIVNGKQGPAALINYKQVNITKYMPIDWGLHLLHKNIRQQQIF